MVCLTRKLEVLTSSQYYGVHKYLIFAINCNVVANVTPSIFYYRWCCESNCHHKLTSGPLRQIWYLIKIFDSRGIFLTSARRSYADADYSTPWSHLAQIKRKKTPADFISLFITCGVRFVPVLNIIRLNVPPQDSMIQ